jgi:hypothetical protein
MELVGLKEALADIGKIKKSFKMTSNNPIEQLILDIANRIIKEMQEGLKMQGSSLSQSIKPLAVVQEGGKISINIEANHYWDFVNQGVNGFRRVNGFQVAFGSPYYFKNLYPSRKMVESFEEGSTRKGVMDAYSDKKNTLSAAWGAAINTKKFGIKPTHFVDKVLSENFINEIAALISKETGKLIFLNIK